MEEGVHYRLHASVSKDWGRVRVRHVASALLINSQDRQFHILALLTKILEPMDFVNYFWSPYIRGPLIRGSAVFTSRLCLGLQSTLRNCQKKVQSIGKNLPWHAAELRPHCPSSRHTPATSQSTNSVTFPDPPPCVFLLRCPEEDEGASTCWITKWRTFTGSNLMVAYRT
jgi:hypothetical protein